MARQAVILHVSAYCPRISIAVALSVVVFTTRPLTRAAEHATLVSPLAYTGMADASAAVAVSSNLFLVADDEENILRLYRTDRGGPPVQEFDMNTFLEVHGKSKEADLEGAARLGDRAFWIGSHGRNKNGKERENRCRLFATDISISGGTVSVVPVGRPYRRLLEDLAADSRFDRFRLAEAEQLAPKEQEAMNIEGLAATVEGHLLVGFRNPNPEGKALLIPLLNPNEVIEGQVGRFGPAMLLGLGGLGIRDLAFYAGQYLIIAGPYHGGGPFRFYLWSGNAAEEPQRIKTEYLGTFHPEAVIVYPESGLKKFQILSDDGKRKPEGISNRILSDPYKTFRSLWMKRS